MNLIILKIYSPMKATSFPCGIVTLISLSICFESVFYFSSSLSLWSTEVYFTSNFYFESVIYFWFLSFSFIMIVDLKFDYERLSEF